jgi:lipid-A-disaccharide synthase
MDKDLNIWIISGESSGDMYGARLCRELHAEAARRGRKLRVAGMGGPRMAGTDMEIMVDSTELGVVGIVEVLKIIGKIVRIFKLLLRKADQEKPDAIVLIDYPGFNLRLAKQLHKRGHKVIWYVSPQVWSWGKRRIPKLAEYCNKMMVIFPFEPEIYAGTGLDVEFVGHPLIEIMTEKRAPDVVRDPNTLLLLPGSRTMEINRLLIPMFNTVLELSRNHSKLRVVLPTPRQKIFDHCTAVYSKFRELHPDMPDIKITSGDTAYWQQRAGTGLAASGTVTVECAIARLPLVVVYKLNFFTAVLAWMLVRLYRGFFTMVNVIADKEVFEEFFQYRVNPGNLVPAVERILPGGSRRTEVEGGMDEVVRLISVDMDGASHRAAVVCLDAVK